MGRAVVSLDFELAGVLDLSECGADVWTKHPDTAPILAGFAIDHEPPNVIGFDLLDKNLVDPTLPEVHYAKVHASDLLNAVGAGAEIHAWNAAFSASGFGYVRRSLT